MGKLENIARLIPCKLSSLKHFKTKPCGTELPQIARRCQDEAKKFISGCEGKVTEEHSSWQSPPVPAYPSDVTKGTFATQAAHFATPTSVRVRLGVSVYSTSATLCLPKHFSSLFFFPDIFEDLQGG